MNTPRSVAWDVYKGLQWIDRVYMVPSMTADEVKRALVEHDGYDADISVAYHSKQS